MIVLRLRLVYEHINWVVVGNVWSGEPWIHYDEQGDEYEGAR
jgi:hypothetical protein